MFGSLLAKCRALSRNEDAEAFRKETHGEIRKIRQSKGPIGGWGLISYDLKDGKITQEYSVPIFERLKEELKSGKSLGGSIDEGFKRAWPAIRDGNISTIITCLILYIFATGLVKGFALTLGIGVLVSMFSAIVITKSF